MLMSSPGGWFDSVWRRLARRQPLLRCPMNGLELVLASFAGVVMGGALDFLIYRGRAEGWLVVPGLEPG